MYKKFLTFIAALLLLAGNFSCSKEELSSEKEIISITANRLIETRVADFKKGVTTIYMIMEEGTDVTCLVPVITVSPGAKIKPGSGSQNDFTERVIYTVTAEDGSSHEYWIAAGAEKKN